VTVGSSKKLKGDAAPFVYCGPVSFESWEGEKPITVRWRLNQELPERLRAEFGLTRPPPH